MQPSRRAFLLAGRAPSGPWGRFYQRLSRSAKGLLEDRTPGAQAPGLACLRPARFTDIHHALVLCAESGVRFALDGFPPAAGFPCLMIDPSGLDALRRLPDGSMQVDAGARVGDVRSHLQDACPGAPDDWTLARWLAEPAGFAPAQFEGSGLASVEVLLADRTMETFGPFGHDSQRGALSLRASRLVSDLFSWVSAPEVQAWRDLARWPGRYRVDALLAETPNLAHLLWGSGGTLAWPESIRLEPAQHLAPGLDAARQAAFGSEVADAAALLDVRIKQRFDPSGVFP